MTSEFQQMLTQIANLEDLEDSLTDGYATDFSEEQRGQILHWTFIIIITFMSVFDLVEPFIANTLKCQITKCQVFILMRLHLNLPVQDLGYRFNVSRLGQQHQEFLPGHPCIFKRMKVSVCGLPEMSFT